MVGLRNRQRMEGHRRKPRRSVVHTEVWGVQDCKERIETRERVSLGNMDKEEECLKIYVGLKDKG